jgi:activator of 2-hydroxyglutaryl-CoA dehydratase
VVWKNIGVFYLGRRRLFMRRQPLVLDRQCASFEGRADGLEHILAPAAGRLCPTGTACCVRLGAAIAVLMDETRQAERAHVFHASLAQALADQAVLIHQRQPFQAIGLSGGVFQNRYLTELVLDRLRSRAYRAPDICQMTGACFGQSWKPSVGEPSCNWAERQHG